MLLLFETPAGFALFKASKKLSKIDNVYEALSDPSAAKKLVNLQAFTKFKSTKEALKCANKLLQGKIPGKLEKFLKKNFIS
jgi:nucleolar protein 58